MAKAVPAAERDQTKARLRTLLTHLEKTKGRNRTQLSLMLGIDKSALSAAAETAGRGVSANIREKLRAVFGVDDAYWTSPVPLDPAACIRLDTGRVIESGPHAAQSKLLAIARKRRESDGVFTAISKIEPETVGADPWAWFERYLEIVDVEHAKMRAARRPA